MAVIRVAVAGAAGRMGREVVRAVSGASDMRLVAAVDTKEAGDSRAPLPGSHRQRRRFQLTSRRRSRPSK